MLYLHKLSDFNRKLVDLESVSLIREMKQKLKFPLASQKVEETAASFFVSEEEVAAMEKALALIEPTLGKVKNLWQRKDSLHEPCNLERAIKILGFLPEHLAGNLDYGKKIFAWQKKATEEMTALVNSLPCLQTKEEKIAANEKISQLFETILRQKEFGFKFMDIVNEGQTAHIKGLSESMNKGSFFHVRLEEEIKKLNFEEIKLRIPAEKLQEVEAMEREVAIIKKGLDKAYEMNMRLVNWAVVWYALVKWANGSK